MLITSYAIVKLQRDKTTRQWTILGQCNDIPGGCRPSMIYPIVAMLDEAGDLVKIQRTHSFGWIDAQEQFGYVKMNFWKRQGLHSEAEAVDSVVVQFVRGLR
jgi:hypothetical protein